MNYTIRQASNILKIKVRTIRVWISTGKLHATKNESGRWVITDEDIAEVKKC